MVGATEGSGGGDVTVRVVSAFQLSELVPTALVWWVRVSAPIVTRTPTPTAAASAFKLLRRRYKLFLSISFLLHRVCVVRADCHCRSTWHHKSRVVGDRHSDPLVRDDAFISNYVVVQALCSWFVCVVAATIEAGRSGFGCTRASAAARPTFGFVVRGFASGSSWVSSRTMRIAPSGRADRGFAVSSASLSSWRRPWVRGNPINSCGAFACGL